LIKRIASFFSKAEGRRMSRLKRGTKGGGKRKKERYFHVPAVFKRDSR